MLHWCDGVPPDSTQRELWLGMEGWHSSACWRVAVAASSELRSVSNHSKVGREVRLTGGRGPLCVMAEPTVLRTG